MRRAASILIPLGSLMILIGLIDPIEGIFLIMPGSALVALGARLAQTPRRWLAYGAFLLLTISIVIVMITSSVFHGVSGWWTLVLLPYPIGIMMDLAGAPFALAGIGSGSWGKTGSVVWLVLAAIVLANLIRLILRVNLIAPWGLAGIAALGCASVGGVLAAERKWG